MKVHNATVRVVQGDLTDHRADVLVNSTDHKLSTNGLFSTLNKIFIENLLLMEMAALLFKICRHSLTN